jgi:1-hydroxycarotenoid 3,4-desaturase
MFARYATYSGASPFRAPATLMLIADAEQQGVWLVEGGMQRLAEVLTNLACGCGAELRCDSEVAAVTTAGGRVSGVRLASGEWLAADAVVVSADSNAVAAGLLGPDVAGTVAPLPVRRRSLSAVTFCLLARTGGFPLARHNVFFSRDYPGEFAALAADRVADDATVYVCAQDRDDAGSGAEGTERLFCLVNAPPLGDRAPLSSAEIDRCTERTFARLAANGLRIDRRAPMVVTTPTDFAARFPGTGGALYGPALHGPMAAFRRPVAATGIAGLYLAGGSVHPGPGVPMATLSGRMAAARLLADLASTRTFQATAMPGGISMPSVTTAGTASR